MRALTDRAGVSQPAVSKHLGVLKLAGLVRDRPDGRLVHYRVEPKSLAPLAPSSSNGRCRIRWKRSGAPSPKAR